MFDPYRRLAAVALALCALALPVTIAAKPDPTEVPRATPSWTLSVDSPVLWQRATPLGVLLVSSGAGLQGVDPVTGNVVWRHAELRNLAAERLDYILNTPFAAVSVDGTNDRVVVIDTLDGRTVFDSRDAGIDQVLGYELLPRNRALLLFGLKGGATVMSLADVDSGKLRWTNDDILAGNSKLLKFAAALIQAVSDTSGMLGDPLEVGDDAFLIASATGIYRVNAGDGSFDWKVSHVRGEASGIRFFADPDRPELFFVASEVQTGTSGSQAGSGMVYTWYSAHRVADGKAVWPKPAKIKGSANDVIFLDQGLLVSSAPDGSRTIKLLDYATGAGKWGKKGKGLDVAGSVIDHAWVDGGLLLVMGHDSAWTNRGVEYHFDIVDVDAGALRFKKALNVKGRLLRTEVLPRGVLYVTTSEINFLDPASGKPLNRPVVSDGTLVTATEGDRVYAFSQDEGALYVVDREKATSTRLSNEKIKLADRDASDMLELRGDRILLTSSQNIVAFGRDGSVQLQAHHPAPRQPALLRALYMATAVRAAMASASTGIYSGALAQVADEQEQGTAGHVIADELSRGYSELSQGYAGISESYFKTANARFKASATSRDAVFMMVRLPGEGLALARVSKETGEIVSAIELGRDKTPSYEVDAIDERVYYRSSPTEIVAYAF